jgi:hypothetical protein
MSAPNAAATHRTTPAKRGTGRTEPAIQTHVATDWRRLVVQIASAR